MKKKKVILTSIIVMVIMMLSIGIKVSFYEPSKINAVIASKVFKTPANTAFKDDNFYKCVVDAYNSKNKTSVAYTESLTDEQLLTITSLSCSASKTDEEKISDASGLEKLSSLAYLNLSYNNLDTLDVSNNTSLTELRVYNNQLISLDVSKNTKLEELYVSNNQLTTLDVSKNIVLTTLYAYDNKLTSLDLGSNTSLEYLHAYQNQLTELDVSNNTALITLYVSSNDLTSLDVSNNTDLSCLGVHYNQLTTLDVSNNTELTELSVSNNKLTTLDISKNTKLEELYVSNNQLTELDASSNTSLTSLYVNENQLTTLDVSKNTALTTLYVSSNQLTELDVSNNMILTEFEAFNNNYLSRIKLSNVLQLKEISSRVKNQSYISIGENKIIEPDEYYEIYINNKIKIKENINVDEFKQNLGLSNLTAKVFNDNTEITSGNVQNGYILQIYDGDVIIQTLPIVVWDNSFFKDENLYKCVVDAYNSKNKTSVAYTESLTDEQLLTITSLNCSGSGKLDIEKISDASGLEKLTSLAYLNLSYNNLDTLDVSYNTALKELRVIKNQLNTLDVSQNTKLIYLDASFNKLTKLDVSYNTALTILYAYENKLNALDVSQNTKLIYLGVSNNQLTSLDVRENTDLIELYISSNLLTELDVSNNTLLTRLDVYKNQLTTLDVSQNTKLIYLGVSNNQLSFGENYVLKGKKIELNSVKLPKDSEKYYITYEVEDDVVEILNNNVINGKNVGKTNVKGTLNGVVTTSSNSDYITVEGNIIVYEVTSDRYIIGNGYIYVGSEKNNETILSNITIEGANVLTKIIENNKLLIKNGEEVLDSFDIVSISSDVYDLDKDYIYVGTSSLNLENINVINGTKEIKDNKLLIKNGNNIVKSFDIISISSSIYDLNKDYIYIGTNSLNLENINVINGTKEIKDNKLLIKKDDGLLENFDLKGISFGILKAGNKAIVIEENISYSDFTGNIILDEVFTYKIFNGEIEVTSGTISKGMVLKIYSGEDIIDTYNIIDEYLDMSKLNIKEDKKHINGFGLGKKVSELKEKISTSGKVTITNPKGVVLTDTGILTTGTKVKIELDTETKEYTVVIKGDVTGTGEASVSDVAKLYQALKGKIEIEDCYKEAGNVVDTDNEIKINDIAKLYQFIKGKIDTLD